jgi:hypothetical protein
MRHGFDADSLIDIPEMFCWTKYGTEAGEDASAILRRKESERQGNRGLFLWGIGNAIGPSVHHLLGQITEPKVVFTPMLSRPSTKDVAPSRVAIWHSGVGLDGCDFEMPEHSVVTSRLSESGRAHYALVCRSDRVLTAGGGSRPASFAASHVMNLRSGSRVGASQVTSVVRRVACALGQVRSGYHVAFVVDLVAPYLVRLTNHTVIR